MSDAFQLMDDDAREMLAAMNAKLDGVTKAVDGLKKTLLGSLDTDTGEAREGIVQIQHATSHAIWGDRSRGEPGMLIRQADLASHIDHEIKMMNEKVDNLIDDKKKIKWMVLGFASASSFFGGVIGWLVGKK